MAHYVAIRNQMTNVQDDDLMHVADDFFGSNSGVVGSSDYEVTQSDPVGMTVDVASGRAYVWCSSLNTHMRTYLDSSTQVSIDSNSSGSTRYDIICIKIDTSITPDADGSNIASIVVVKGTPGSGVPSTPANHYKLAEVEVADGETEITDNEITDTRNQIPYLKEHNQDGSHKSLSVDTISEKTADAGVTIDGLLIKDGEAAKATVLNTDVKARVTLSSSQSIPTGTWTKINLDSAVYNPGNYFDTTTNYRFDVPVTGYYLIIGKTHWETMSDGTAIGAAIRVNGSEIAPYVDYQGASGVSFAITSCILYLSSGDYVELWGYHTYGSNKNVFAGELYTCLDIHLLSV